MRGKVVKRWLSLPVEMLSKVRSEGWGRVDQAKHKRK